MHKGEHVPCCFMCVGEERECSCALNGRALSRACSYRGGVFDRCFHTPLTRRPQWLIPAAGPAGPQLRGICSLPCTRLCSCCLRHSGRRCRSQSGRGEEQCTAQADEGGTGCIWVCACLFVLGVSCPLEALPPSYLTSTYGHTHHPPSSSPPAVRWPPLTQAHPPR